MTTGAPLSDPTGGMEPPPQFPPTAAAPSILRGAKDRNSDLSCEQRRVPYPSEKLMRSIAAKLPPPHAAGGVTSGVVIQQMAGWTPLTVKDVLRHMVKRKKAITFTGRDAKGHRKVFYKRAPVTPDNGAST